MIFWMSFGVRVIKDICEVRDNTKSPSAGLVFSFAANAIARTSEIGITLNWGRARKNFTF